MAERRTAYRAHRLVASAAPPRRPEETASPMADDEIYFDPADFEDEDDEPAVAFALDDDDDDDEDDDDDDSWFFVPEGANVSTKEEDLYVVGDDYDDDESFGFAQGFTDVTEQDDDEVDGYRSRTKKGGKSNLRRRERNTPADVNGIKDGLKVDANNKGELTMNNKGELTTKQLKELAKKEEETEKMLEMGVPKALLRKLESEKRGGGRVQRPEAKGELQKDAQEAHHRRRLAVQAQAALALRSRHQADDGDGPRRRV